MHSSMSHQRVIMIFKHMSHVGMRYMRLTTLTGVRHMKDSRVWDTGIKTKIQVSLALILNGILRRRVRLKGISLRDDTSSYNALHSSNSHTSTLYLD